jgi:PAS domain S-box-containing protein
LVESYVGEAGEPFPLTARQTAEVSTRYDGARFGLLAHDAAADPLFTFANDTALRAFGYTRDELIGMPSRLSASVGVDLEERKRLFQALESTGHYSPYCGRRRSKDGSTFWIFGTAIWNVTDEIGQRLGQAALIREFRHAGPSTADD